MEKVIITIQPSHTEVEHVDGETWKKYQYYRVVVNGRQVNFCNIR